MLQWGNHINKSSACFHLCNISHLCPSLPSPSSHLSILVHKLVTSCINFCNSCLQPPLPSLNNLQRVQNSAAQVATNFTLIQPHHTCSPAGPLDPGHILNWLQTPADDFQSHPQHPSPIPFSSTLPSLYPLVTQILTILPASAPLLCPQSLETHLSPSVFESNSKTSWKSLNCNCFKNGLLLFDCDIEASDNGFYSLVFSISTVS